MIQRRYAIAIFTELRRLRGFERVMIPFGQRILTLRRSEKQLTLTNFKLISCNWISELFSMIDEEGIIMHR